MLVSPIAAMESVTLHMELVGREGELQGSFLGGGAVRSYLFFGVTRLFLDLARMELYLLS